MEQKEALEYLVNLGMDYDPLVKTEKGLFSKKRLERVCQPLVDTICVNSLTGLVDYIKTNIDKIDTKLLVHVESPDRVGLYSPLNEDGNRKKYIEARYEGPDNIYYGHYMSTEQFNIMLQSSFVKNEDRDILLKYTGLIKDEAVKTTGDDGISQQVTVKTGVATLGNAIVPNPVTLAPYRTFLEIEQPVSKFIFRMQDGPKAALFEADGGAWKNKAMLDIKKFLQGELKEYNQVQIIA